MALQLKGGSSLDSLSLPAKAAVGGVFFVLVAAAYFLIFYSDVDTNIASQVQTREAKKRQLADAQEAKKAYNRDIAEKTRREGLARKQKKILPDEAEAPAFLASLQTTATISGVKLSSWKPLDEQPQEFYAKVPMELQLEGKFHQVAKFFHGIGQVDRIINMENIVIGVPRAAKKKTDTTDQSVEVKVSCLATAFRALSADETGGKGRNRKKGKRK